MEDKYNLALHYLTINNSKYGVYCDQYQRCPQGFSKFIKYNECHRVISCAECWNESIDKELTKTP
ncbi:MAG TPA: hypothetical protein VIK72_16950 [Clostridiaceae bacterium]